jgi:hypothetical protein
MFNLIKKYMNKYTLYYVTLVSGIILCLGLPKYNQHVFVLKHTLIYILAASVIIMLVKKIYQIVLMRYKDVFVDKKLYFLKGFTIFVVIGLLGLSRYLQLDYIKLYETPPIAYCYYYDEYGNYIHGSRFSYVCPELEIRSKNASSLKFRVAYEYPGNRQDRLNKTNVTPYYLGKDGYGVVDVEIHYNDQNYITLYQSQTSINYELYEFENNDALKNKDLVTDDAIKQYYQSLMLVIETDYNQNSVTQTKKLYVKEPENAQFKDVKVIEHFDFSKSKYYEDTSKIQVVNRELNKVNFEVYQSYNQNEELVTRVSELGTITYNTGFTKLFIERNPELFLFPRSTTYTMTDDQITKLSQNGTSVDTDEYMAIKDDTPPIQTYFSNGHSAFEAYGYSGDVYELDDSVIIEGKFETYKMYSTDFGYQIEEYRGDGIRKEVPYSEEDFLTRWFMGTDNLVLGYNPIALEYENQPIMNLNPMLQYIIDQNKS